MSSIERYDITGKHPEKVHLEEELRSVQEEKSQVEIQLINDGFESNTRMRQRVRKYEKGHPLEPEPPAAALNVIEKHNRLEELRKREQELKTSLFRIDPTEER